MKLVRKLEGDIDWTGAEGAPGGGRRRVGVAAALFVILAVIGGLVVVVRSGTHGNPGGPGAQPVASTGAAPTRTTGTPATPLVTAIPTAAPAGATWEVFRGVALPVSSSSGPRSAAPVRAGYSHDPNGALIAALQIAARHLITTGTAWRDVTERQVMPGPGRDAYITARSSVTDDPPTTGFGQTAGFRFIAYSPDVAVIEVATSFRSRPDYQVTNLTVQWHDGDWRLLLQPDGGMSTSAGSASSLTGYIKFSGVS